MTIRIYSQCNDLLPRHNRNLNIVYIPELLKARAISTSDVCEKALLVGVAIRNEREGLR